MGLAMSKFLNTATHFSFESLWSLMTSGLTPAIASFGSIVGQGSAFGTESDALTPVNGNFTITRIRAIAGANSLTVPCVITFRDDGVDTLATISIPAGNTAIQDSGALNVAIVGGSLCSLGYTSGAGAGGIDQIGIEVQIQRAIA